MEMTAIRASSLPELFDCPARWEAKHLCGRRLPRSAAAQLGTAVHAGAAVFDVQRILGSPITPDDAAGEVVDAIHHPREDVDWGEDSPREAERIALALHGLYCRNIAPARNYVAVEATCERLEITDLGLALTGTTDRITTNALGDLGIADIKTGKTAVAADGRSCRPDWCV
ncbi:PD-(D/E)XK nuclease family protein [Desulfovibrio sp.]|uniref:PD-(D/E)XK nuclease family protein n=1 Tax=Desulfovibrio sp. TaxID=885 RepID=UPI002A765880|nr:PD-(D/E)XK nuclease family protein [Desulfovibrio sp.]MDY2666005.1 PD-(D/E)XK nuclease family protein [Desulfovibrio sp.]